MTYGVWTDGLDITLCPKSEPPAEWEGLHELVAEFEAESWEKANQELHRLQGWEPYVPMEVSEADHAELERRGR